MFKRLFNLDWVIVGLVFILLFLGLFVLKKYFSFLIYSTAYLGCFWGFLSFLSLAVLTMNATKGYLGFFTLPQYSFCLLLFYSEPLLVGQ